MGAPLTPGEATTKAKGCAGRPCSVPLAFVGVPDKDDDDDDGDDESARHDETMMTEGWRMCEE